MTQPNGLDQQDIDYVNALIAKAGALAPQLRADIEIVEKSGPHDRVTTADFELSKLIVSELGKRFSADRIISEEDTTHDTIGKKGRIWLVDPIDGTDNYISNDGQYSVMIGLVIDSKPVFGWVFAPTTSIMYSEDPALALGDNALAKLHHALVIWLECDPRTMPA